MTGRYSDTHSQASGVSEWVRALENWFSCFHLSSAAAEPILSLPQWIGRATQWGAGGRLEICHGRTLGQSVVIRQQLASLRALHSALNAREWRARKEDPCTVKRTSPAPTWHATTSTDVTGEPLVVSSRRERKSASAPRVLLIWGVIYTHHFGLLLSRRLFFCDLKSVIMFTLSVPPT